MRFVSTSIYRVVDPMSHDVLSITLGQHDSKRQAPHAWRMSSVAIRLPATPIDSKMMIANSKFVHSTFPEQKKGNLQRGTMCMCKSGKSNTEPMPWRDSQSKCLAFCWRLCNNPLAHAENSIQWRWFESSNQRRIHRWICMTVCVIMHACMHSCIHAPNVSDLRRWQEGLGSMPLRPKGDHHSFFSYHAAWCLGVGWDWILCPLVLF
jgi:hypothetical protein